MANRPKLCPVEFLSRFMGFTSSLAIAFGVMVLAGWTFHVPRLKSIFTGQVAVKANTAICFMLIGAAVLLVRKAGEDRRRRLLSKCLALAASIIGALSFMEFWRGWDLGIDQLLFVAGAEDIPGSVRPGLMSPIAALDFFLLGITIVLLGSSPVWFRWLQSIFATVAAVAAVFGILDFVLDPGNTHTHIAPLTAFILLLLSFAVLLARPQYGLGELLVSPDVGGVLCRRLLPASVVVPIVIGWLRWKGQQAGLYSDWTGLVIMTVSSGLLLAGVTIWTAAAVKRTDAERGKAQASANRLAAIVQSSQDAIVGKTLDGVVTSWNPAAETIYGYSAEEMIGEKVTRVIPPDRLEEFEGFLANLRTGGTTRHHETERLRKDGRRISVSISSSPVRDEKGSVIGASTIARDITEAKQAQEKLREASLYTRNLIEASLDPLVTISRAGKITDVNEATEKATGVSREQLIGSDFSEYFTEPQKAQQGYSRVFEEGFVRDYPLSIRHTSGAVMEVLYNATVFRDIHGVIAGVFAAARDVTAVKRAQEKLREASLYTRSLIEASLDPLVTISKEGKITDVNQATEQATGLGREKLIGSDFSQYFTEPDRARTGYERVFAEGFVHDYPLAIRHSSGTTTQVLYNATVFRNSRCEIAGVFAAARDVTALKRTEQELRLSRERLRLALHAGHAGTFDWDMANNINLWTPEAEAVHGLMPGEFGGKYEDWEALVVADDLPAARASIKSSLKTGEFSGEWRIRRRNDGQVRWIAARARVLTDDSGQPSRMIGVNVDVTERKQAEEEVRKLNDELEERVAQRTAQLEAANKELEAFTYSVSHDLRAPLRHISGFSKILTEEFGAKLPPEAQHHVQRIEEGTRRMGQLVDDLLNLGRVGRRELSLQVAGLRSIVNEVIDGLKLEAGNRKVEWKIGNLPYVECDTTLMHQVFQNLLSNALKFTRPRPEAVIEIGQQATDAGNAVYVRDNGVGFSMKYADKLFGVFQRLHRVEDFDGTGVGLATVLRIVQKHGGRIWAEAELDKGATFFFTLGSSEDSTDKAKEIMVGEKS